jgi:glutamyl-tRNA synthetase
LLAWLSIRSRGGKLLLRMEDIDSPRIKPWAAEQAIDDLRWLGLDWDEGPDRPGDLGPYVQTERLPLYASAFERLKATGRVYPCTCTRSDVLAAASAPHIGQEGPIYPGTCSHRMPDDSAAITGPYCWRFHVEGHEHVEDGFSGPHDFDMPRDLGDFVIHKSDGTPAYQLAVVADDHAMGITEVLRGDDLLPSAARQQQIHAALGWQAPAWTHVPLVTGTDGRRLAKRHGDTRLSTLREQGIPPDRLIGLLAHSCGWLDTPRPCSASALLDRFTLATLPRAPWVFDFEAQAFLGLR